MDDWSMGQETEIWNRFWDVSEVTAGVLREESVQVLKEYFGRE